MGEALEEDYPWHLCLSCPGTLAVAGAAEVAVNGSKVAGTLAFQRSSVAEAGAPDSSVAGGTIRSSPLRDDGINGRHQVSICNPRAS